MLRTLQDYGLCLPNYVQPNSLKHFQGGCFKISFQNDPDRFSSIRSYDVNISVFKIELRTGFMSPKFDTDS